MALAPVTFTAQQVSAGRGFFGGACSGCHGETLAGMDGGPPLTGPLFAHWFTDNVGALVSFVQTNMPLDRPGSLTPAQTLNLVSFILSSNGFAPGEVALPEDPAALALLGFRQ